MCKGIEMLEDLVEIGLKASQRMMQTCEEQGIVFSPIEIV